METAPEPKTIINSIAYHWSEADRSVIHFPNSKGREHVPRVINSDAASMSRLGLLPVEILHNIFRELDFETLGSIRCLNSQSKETVEKFSAYRDLTAFAHDALRALSGTNLLSRYTAKDLYSTLCQRQCSGCGDFGSFLFLPTARRCCFTCIDLNPEIDVVSALTAAGLFGLTDSALRRISILIAVPGEYGLSQKRHQRRTRLVSRGEARQLGISIHGSEQEMERAVALAIRRGTRLGDEPRPRRLPHNQSIFIQPPSGSYVLRFMACAPFPYLDVQTRQINKGVWCRGCEYDWYKSDDEDSLALGYLVIQELYRKQNKTFSEDEFLVHFENCRSARMLWEEFIQKDKNFSESFSDALFRS